MKKKYITPNLKTKLFENDLIMLNSSTIAGAEVPETLNTFSSNSIGSIEFVKITD